MEKILDNVPLPASPTFAPSRPILITGEQIALDFILTISGRAPVRVLWYFEFSEENPYSSSALWFPETAEEDIGNGDVRMPLALRRFSTQGADGDLPAGATYYRCAQFKRVHKFARLQMSGAGCIATVYSVFGEIPTSP